MREDGVSRESKARGTNFHPRSDGPCGASPGMATALTANAPVFLHSPICGVCDGLRSSCCYAEKAELKWGGNRDAVGHYERGYRVGGRGTRAHQNILTSGLQTREGVLDFIVNAKACCLEQSSTQHFNAWVVALLPSSALGT
eukprot:GFKZ01010663.1.p1 GENE.GFKZ01010663.1~~GFKZ01010663.1.p1  ORF type:complete len:142 (+),score=3.62 GFKZ01010663.1:401-826(+)